MLHQRDIISSERSESSDNEHLFPNFRVVLANSILGKRMDLVVLIKNSALIRPERFKCDPYSLLDISAWVLDTNRMKIV